MSEPMKPLTTRQIIEELSRYPLDAVPTMSMAIEVTTMVETPYDRKNGNKSNHSVTSTVFVHGNIWGVQGSTGGGKPPQVSISGN